MHATNHHVKIVVPVLMYMMIIGVNVQMIIMVRLNLFMDIFILICCVLGTNCQTSK